VLRCLQPLEYNHLGRHDLRAMAFHPADRRLLALRASRSQGVAHEKDATAMADEAEHSLENADVSLTTGHHYRVVFGEPLQEVGLAARVKCHFVGERGGSSNQFPDGRPEPLRVLLSEQGRNIKQRRGINEPPRIRDRIGPLVDSRHELGLEVDDEECRRLGVHRQQGSNLSQPVGSVSHIGFHQRERRRSEHADAARMQEEEQSRRVGENVHHEQVRVGL
jgi:hypothetical protein